MIPRVNKQSCGNLSAGIFDATDPISGQALDETSVVRMFGARYTWDVSSGIPRLITVAGTDGPVIGLFPWPPKSPRVLAQLSFCFPAKITTASPLKATPVKSASAGTPTMETTLDEMTVSTLDGTSPAVGTFGLVVVGSELGAQHPIFFQGGSGGAGSKIYKVMSYAASPDTYSLQEYDYPSGSTIGSELDGKELNGSIIVPNDADSGAGQWVEGTMRPDGFVWFSMPLGC